MNIKRAFLVLAAALLLPGLAMAQTTAVTTFEVDFEFNDSNDWDSTVAHISCNGGLPLTNEQDVENGSVITFVLEFAQAGDIGNTDCDIWVDDVSGYTAEYNSSGDSQNSDDSAGCHFVDATDGDDNFCEIDMDPDVKTWDVVGAATDVLDIDFSASITACARNEGVILGSFHNNSSNLYCRSEGVSGPGLGRVTFTINTRHDGDLIIISESVFDSAVESDSSDCPNFIARPGGRYDCTIVNTVFFEGIPTLNQYGLAIMALLMLGVGFVGFRRFVSVAQAPRGFFYCKRSLAADR